MGFHYNSGTEAELTMDTHNETMKIHDVGEQSQGVFWCTMGIEQSRTDFEISHGNQWC
jgi:hypothetical protein